MDTKTSYSSAVSIYLEIDDRIIQLGELLGAEGTLLEAAEISPNTKAVLVVAIDGERRTEKVVIENGISKLARRIRFSYPSEDSEDSQIPF